MNTSFPLSEGDTKHFSPRCMFLPSLQHFFIDIFDICRKCLECRDKSRQSTRKINLPAQISLLHSKIESWVHKYILSVFMWDGQHEQIINAQIHQPTCHCSVPSHYSSSVIYFIILDQTFVKSLNTSLDFTLSIFFWHFSFYLYL